MAHDPPTDPLDLPAVRRVAHLARLSPSEEQLEDARSQLTDILRHMARLQTLDLEGVEPLTHPTPTDPPLDDDTPHPHLSRDTLMNMAPDAIPPFIVVPKILDNS